MTTIDWKHHAMDLYQLKEASVIDAKATPPTTGRRDETTHSVGYCSNKGKWKRKT